MVWLGKHALKVCSKSPPESSSLKVIKISGCKKPQEWEGEKLKNLIYKQTVLDHLFLATLHAAKTL